MKYRAHKLSQTISLMAAILLVAGILSCNHNKRYSLQAQVTAKDLSMREITLKHGDIPGFMPAMTMPYRLNNVQALQDVEPGDKITAEVVVANGGRDYWLEDVRITDRSGRGQVKPEAPPSRMLTPGEAAPNIRLINQDGRTIHLGDFRGKALLVTFIYTRCPLPDFCPRVSSQFARIHDEFKKSAEDYGHTHLLTISFDPKYDTPPVLRKYGLAYLDGDTTGFSHWDFATGNPKDLKTLAGDFGLSYEEQDGQISHTMSIALIAPDGTIVKFWGSNWTWTELADSMRRAFHSSGQRSEVHGQALYEDLCARCHDSPNPDLRKQPPSLHGLFLTGTLPSGARATDEQVRHTILGGLRTMPSFGQSLSESDAKDIVEYLRTKQ